MPIRRWRGPQGSFPANGSGEAGRKAQQVFARTGETALLTDQLGIHPLGDEQLFMGTALHHSPVLEHDDLIGITNRAQSVSDHDSSPSLLS